MSSFPPRSRRTGRVWPALLAVGALVGCQTGEPPIPGESVGEVDEVEAPAVGTIQTGREVELSTAADRAALSFRADGAAFRAASTTHRVRAAGGVVQIAPQARDGQSSAAELLIETSAIGRGDLALDVAPGPVAVSGDGALEIARGEVVERIDNRAAGVEQSWVFFDAPEAPGDLEVVVRVGGRFVRSSEAGLHFTSGGLAFRYSHGVWVDANGNESEVLARYEDGAIRLTVPNEVVENSAYPAILDPTVTSELVVDTAVFGATGTQARVPVVAVVGTQALAVWRDDRNGANSDIYATRIDSGGNVLGNLNIAVNTAAGVQDDPAVATVAGGYLVVWETADNIAAASLTSGGTVTQRGNVVATAAVEADPAVVGRGNQGLVAWSSDGDIRGSIYAGSTFGASFAIAATGASEVTPAVAVNPSGNYLVVWVEGAANQDVRGQFVTPAGALSGAAFTISAAAGVQDAPSAAWNPAGSNFVVVWANNSEGRDIYGTRVATNGTVLDTRAEGMATVGGIAITTAANNQLTPQIACATGGCFATWRDLRNTATSGNDIYGRAISGTFTFPGADVPVQARGREQQSPAVVASGASYWAVWQDARDGGPYYAYAARLDGSGVIQDADGIRLVRGYNRETGPGVAPSSANWLALWSDSRVAGNDIVGVRVSGTGVVGDSSARTVSNATGDQATPELAFAGTRYLAVWSDDRNADADIYAGRINVDGSLVDGGGIAVTNASGDQLIPAVATDGTNWLVVWQDRRNLSIGNDIFAAVVSAAGAVTVGNIQVCSSVGEQTSPAVAYDPIAGQYIVVWSDGRAGDANTSDIYGARVTTAGAVLDACGVAISSAPGPQFAPDIDVQPSTGTALVAWDDRRSDSGNIYGSRVRITGGGLSVLDPGGIAIGIAAAKQTTPAVGFISNSFLVVWADERALATNATDIYANTVSATGTPSTAFAIATSTSDEANPAIGNPITPDGFMAIFYQRQDPSLQTTRVVFRRLKTSAGTGVACSTASQCETGFCVDGKCCDSACGAGNTIDCQACSTTRGAAQDGICGPVVDNRICRNYADPFCDLRELCNGVDLECPADVGRRAGRTCTTPGGSSGTCPGNDADSAPHVCQ